MTAEVAVPEEPPAEKPQPPEKPKCKFASRQAPAKPKPSAAPHVPDPKAEQVSAEIEADATDDPAGRMPIGAARSVSRSRSPSQADAASRSPSQAGAASHSQSWAGAARSSAHVPVPPWRMPKYHAARPPWPASGPAVSMIDDYRRQKYDAHGRLHNATSSSAARVRRSQKRQAKQEAYEIEHKDDELDE